jgi:hypothetical protein
MASNKGKIIIGSVISCAILCLIFVTVVRPRPRRPDSIQPQSPPNAPARRQGSAIDEIKKHFPKVDYDAPEPTDPVERAKRRAKGKHYDNGHISPRPTTHSSGLESEWDLVVADFPVQQSNVVVIGKTLNGGAFMSPDKTGVYTEVSLKIEDVLYKDEDTSINDQTIAISRTGGVVRYPTGEESLFLIVGQNMPTLDKRYLFFLKSIPNTDGFEILTGYELSSSGVLALDNPMKFRQYNGQDVTRFIQAVRSLLQPSK